MNLKKFGVSVALAGVAMVLPLTSAFAASGWQKLGTYSGGQIFKSGGGNVKICAHVAAGIENFSIWENDPGTTGSGKDDFVKDLYLSDGQCVSFSVDKFVDGDNKKAELYYSPNSSGTSVTVYD